MVIGGAFARREEAIVSKWQAMRDRKTIHDFPCPREGWAKGEFRLRCYPELEKCGLDGECSYEFAYRQYIALRAVVAAMLEDVSPANEAMVARKSAEMSWAKRTPGAVRRMIEKAEAWEAIA